jgi:hypothetical protein
MVGAIHGRLLTAWSAAGIFGPVIVNYIREYQLAHGVPRAQVYDITMYVLCALLALGFLCNHLLRPVGERHFMTDADLKAEARLAREGTAGLTLPSGSAGAAPAGTGAAKLWLAWLAVGIPLAWGVWMTLSKAFVLFR